MINYSVCLKIQRSIDIIDNELIQNSLYKNLQYISKTRFSLFNYSFSNTSNT
jgi:hypothetical protein